MTTNDTFDRDIFEELFTEASEVAVVEQHIDPNSEALFMHGTEGIIVKVDKEDGTRLTVGEALAMYAEKLGIMREPEKMNVRLDSGFIPHERELEPGLIYNVNQRVDSKGVALA